MTWILATFPAPFWLTVLVLLTVAVVAFALGQMWAYGRLDTDAAVDHATAMQAAFERGSLSGYADMRVIVRDALAQFPTSLGGRAIARAVGVDVPPLRRYAKAPAFGATDDDVRALIVDAPRTPTTARVGPYTASATNGSLTLTNADAPFTLTTGEGAE